MISLRSFDGETFEVDEAVALESETIKHLIEDDCANTSIPLHNVTGKILAKVIEYCKRHVEGPKAEDMTAKVDLKTFDAEFVKVDQSTLFYLMLVIFPICPSLGDRDTQYLLLVGDDRYPMELVEAANYSNIKSLLDLTCQTVADMIKGKTPEEICKTFNI
ncbi:hypothetical protein H5410_052643 [Solanum commersonii]|uniref:SKP1-like protein n=1 Tax=Solanum commersonii TaxID=4109 RepID=A0A9J5X4Q0_SOLCO|nr:hypothetical protein H5410_052643 [Solanum commersonii]